MSKRPSIKDKLSLGEKKESFFADTSNVEMYKNEDENKEEELKRQTYYLTKELIRALALMSAYKEIDKSEIVREALKEYIPETFLAEARKVIK